MEKLANVHPGEVLNFEFLEPLEISAYRLSFINYDKFLYF